MVPSLRYEITFLNKSPILFSFYSISLTPKFYYCSMSLHDQQPKLINTCIAYTRYLHELSGYRRLAKCFSESILNQAN